MKTNLTKASTQKCYLSFVSTENQAVENIDHYTQNEWVLQPNLLTHQFSLETLRKPVDTEVLQSKSPGSNCKRLVGETHGLSSPAGKIQLPWRAARTAPPKQRSWQGGQGSGLNPKISSPTVPGQEQRVGDSNQGQPHSSQA